jgi:uncharacterized protein (DUF302 family)
MYYQKTTQKDFNQASEDLQEIVVKHNFGVLHVHDLGNTLRSKGIDFEEDCHVLEVCNPGQAKKVLTIDMQLNMALPCRISVWTENGETKIGMIKPEKMLSDLSDDSRLHEIAKEVEQATKTMIDEAA